MTLKEPLVCTDHLYVTTRTKRVLRTGASSIRKIKSCLYCSILLLRTVRPSDKIELSNYPLRSLGHDRIIKLPAEIWSMVTLRE